MSAFAWAAAAAGLALWAGWAAFRGLRRRRRRFRGRCVDCGAPAAAGRQWCDGCLAGWL